MTTEEQFFEETVAFLRSTLGDDSVEIGPDTDLQEADFFDSLMLVSFLEYVEERRGSPIPISPDTGLPIDALSSIRAAYEQLILPAQEESSAG